MPKIMFTSNVRVGLRRNVWIVTFPPLSTSGMVMVQQPADSEIMMVRGGSCQDLHIEAAESLQS